MAQSGQHLMLSFGSVRDLRVLGSSSMWGLCAQGVCLGFSLPLRPCSPVCTLFLSLKYNKSLKKKKSENNAGAQHFPFHQDSLFLPNLRGKCRLLSTLATLLDCSDAGFHPRPPIPWNSHPGIWGRGDITALLRSITFWCIREYFWINLFSFLFSSLVKMSL